MVGSVGPPSNFGPIQQIGPFKGWMVKPLEWTVWFHANQSIIDLTKIMSVSVPMTPFALL